MDIPTFQSYEPCGLLWEKVVAHLTKNSEKQTGRITLRSLFTDVDIL